MPVAIYAKAPKQQNSRETPFNPENLHAPSLQSNPTRKERGFIKGLVACEKKKKLLINPASMCNIFLSPSVQLPCVYYQITPVPATNHVKPSTVARPIPNANPIALFSMSPIAPLQVAHTYPSARLVYGCGVYIPNWYWL